MKTNKNLTTKFKLWNCKHPCTTATIRRVFFLCCSRKEKCPKCDVIYETSIQLVEHLRTAHDISKAYECPQCDHTDRDRLKVVIHMRTAHATERTHVCKKCHKRFAVVRFLLSHNRKHKPNKEYSCNCCDFATGTQVNLFYITFFNTGCCEMKYWEGFHVKGVRGREREHHTKSNKIDKRKRGNQLVSISQTYFAGPFFEIKLEIRFSKSTLESIAIRF